MAGKVVIVVGTRGVGKSSLLAKVPKKYKVVNIGDVMLGIARRERMVKSRDQIRRLHNAAYNKLKLKAYNAIAAMSGDIILDTHATILHNGRFVPGLPLSFVRKLNVAGLVYVDADIETLLRRAQRDKERRREPEPRQVLLDNRYISLAIFSYYSAYLNIPIYIINNEEGRLQNARKRLIEHLEDAFGK